jgi:hypothetical protein
MCECRKELEQDSSGAIAQHISRKFRGAPTNKIDFDEVAFPMVRVEGAVKMRCVTYSNVKVTVEGRKKAVSITVLHTFCPFCGVKYD